MKIHKLNTKRPGNEIGLFYNAPEPTWSTTGRQFVVFTTSIDKLAVDLILRRVCFGLLFALAHTCQIYNLS